MMEDRLPTGDIYVLGLIADQRLMKDQEGHEEGRSWAQFLW